MTEILLYGIIGDSWDGLDAATVVPLISDSEGDLDIRINSPGGYCMDGLAILNALLRVQANGRKVTTHNDGLAASMGSVIMMAGETRTMADNALMMIHNPWDVAMGDAAELRRAADKLDLIRDQLVKVYGQKTGVGADDLVAMMETETWFTSEQALEQNFVTVVTEAVSAAACDVSAFGFRKGPDNPHLVTSAAAVIQSIVTGGARTGISSAVAAILKPKETTMDPKGKQAAVDPAIVVIENPPQPEPKGATLTAEQAKGIADTAVAAERVRTSTIRSLCDKHKLGADFAKTLIDDDKMTVEAARAAILDKLADASDAANIGGNGPIAVTKDARDKWLEGASAWIIARSGVASIVERAAKAKGETIRIDPGEFRGVSMVDLARESLQRNGQNIRSRDPQIIMGDAFTARGEISQTTGDFSVLLENTLHKIIQAAYAVTPDTWTKFCGVGSVTDFRDHNRYLLGSFGALDTVNEGDEFKNKPIPDGGKEKIRATTKGNLINLSRQAMINDDMGAFSTLAVALGRGAKLTVEVDVYALINSNPTMNDGIALFHASHGNLVASGTAPTVAAVDAMRVQMASQKDVSGNDYLEIRPDVAVLPIGLGGALRVVNGSQYDPDTANKLQRMNIAFGIFKEIVDTPRLTGTPWYAFADKDVAPAIEVAFLNGVQEPFLDSRLGWTVDGTEWKVRLDYGVGAVNFRSAIKNPGA